VSDDLVGVISWPSVIQHLNLQQKSSCVLFLSLSSVIFIQCLSRLVSFCSRLAFKHGLEYDDTISFLHVLYLGLHFKPEPFLLSQFCCCKQMYGWIKLQIHFSQNKSV